MSNTRPPYAPEFREQMVELVRSGRSPEELARELEPSAQAIRNWISQADRNEGRRSDGLTSAEREELRRLRRENRQLRQEREILAKAAAWFARETYGAPRIHAELVDQGHAVSRKRIARLMRSADLAGISRRKGTRTTVRDARARAAAGLVERNFTAEAPDQLWVADITCIPTWAGFLYLAVVLNVFDRRVIGWSMANHLRTRLVLDALDMALWQRRPDGVIHHSDQGSQYTSIAFGKHCRDAGVRPSTGSVGDCYDNAMCESFFATLECELLDRSRFKSHAEARRAVFEFIEGWYNPRRRHSAIGYLSPVNYERSQLPPARPNP